MEVLTGGLIKALPHAVIPNRGQEKIVSRNSMALFIDPAPQKSLEVPPERTEQELFQCD
jgi:isopenicillin N synthase-like dioxygenase